MISRTSSTRRDMGYNNLYKGMIPVSLARVLSVKHEMVVV